MAKHIIIDTDPGNGFPGSDVDDGLAIGLALCHPSVRLEGLTVVAGNVELEHGIRSALALLEAADAADRVPVCVGASVPLVRDRTVLNERRLQRRANPRIKDLWQGIPLPTPVHKQDPRRATDFLIDTVMSAPDEITIVAIGPLTNVALAIKVEPRLKDSVHQIIAMAGAVRVPGTTNPALEFNAMYDPEATFIVLHSGIPITLVPLDVTTQTCLTPNDVERLRGSGTRFNQYLADTTAPWVRWVMESRRLAGCWLHDPLAVAVAIDPTIVETTNMHVTVELGGNLTTGQTVGYGSYGYTLPQESGPNVQVALGLDNSRFMALLFDAFGKPVHPSG